MFLFSLLYLYYYKVKMFKKKYEVAGVRINNEIENKEEYFMPGFKNVERWNQM